MSILVTRPAQQADQLCALLQAQGLEVVRFPLLTIQAVALDAAKLKLLAQNSIDWVIFISANAVNCALARNDGTIRSACTQAKIAAVGRTTAAALQAQDIRVDLVPTQGFNSEALLASGELQQVAGKRCVLVRGVGGRELLSETLQQRGAQVQYLEVYRREAPLNPAPLIALLAQKQLTAITISSTEALQNLHTLVPVSWQQQLFNIPLVVLSERQALLAKTLGFKCSLVSTTLSDEGVCTTIIKLVSGEYSG